MTTTRIKYSPAPWSYEYNPYTMSESVREANPAADTEIPAFEICDTDGNKLFDTNEDSPEDSSGSQCPAGRGSPGNALVAHRMCQPTRRLRRIRRVGGRSLPTGHRHH